MVHAANQSRLRDRGRGNIHDDFPPLQILKVVHHDHQLLGRLVDICFCNLNIEPWESNQLSKVSRPVIQQHQRVNRIKFVCQLHGVRSGYFVT